MNFLMPTPFRFATPGSKQTPPKRRDVVKPTFTALAVLLSMMFSTSLTAQNVSSAAGATSPERTSERLVVSPIKAPEHVLRFEPSDLETKLLPTFTPRRTPASANIVVNYTGFPAAAEAAFQHAVDLVEPWLDSDQEIRVQATWILLQSCQPGQGCILGAAGPNFLYGVPAGGGTFLAGDALADTRTGVDQMPGEPDILARFNAGFPAWYLGTDGQPLPDQVDFVSVVIHELFHGLGFAGTATVDDGLGDRECGGVVGRGCYGLGTGLIGFYDFFVDIPPGTPLEDIPNNTETLGDALQSGDVFFVGEETAGAVGGIAELYAPAVFERGSSYSHFDETVFPQGTEHSLMTPVQSNGEVNHSPGAALCLLSDLGWFVNQICSSFLLDEFESGDFSAWTKLKN